MYIRFKCEHRKSSANLSIQSHDERQSLRINRWNKKYPPQPADFGWSSFVANCANLWGRLQCWDCSLDADLGRCQFFGLDFSWNNYFWQHKTVICVLLHVLVRLVHKIDAIQSETDERNTLLCKQTVFSRVVVLQNDSFRDLTLVCHELWIKINIDQADYRLEWLWLHLQLVQEDGNIPHPLLFHIPTSWSKKSFLQQDQSWYPVYWGHCLAL